MFLELGPCPSACEDLSDANERGDGHVPRRPEGHVGVGDVAPRAERRFTSRRET